MIKEAKYILAQVFVSLWKDLNLLIKSVGENSKRPNEILNFIFLLFIAMMLMGKYNTAGILALFFVVAYVWKIYKQGEWKNRMRQNYIKWK